MANARRSFNCNVQKQNQIRFEIVEILSKEYSIRSLYEILNVSRSGYYKWLKNKDVLNNYEINRRDLGDLIQDIHKRKPSYVLNYKTPIEYKTQLGFK